MAMTTVRVDAKIELFLVTIAITDSQKKNRLSWDACQFSVNLVLM